MEPTWRAWIVLAVGGVGAALAAVFSTAVLFAIPVGAGTWLLVNRLAFARSVERLRSADPPAVSQSLVDERIDADGSTTLRIRFDDPDGMLGGLRGVIDLSLPASIVTDTERTRGVPEDDTAEIEVPIRAPLAGSFEIGAPSLRLASGRGLFHETLRIGNACSIRVDPPVQHTESTAGSETRVTSRTHLFIDRRANMHEGRPGQTKLDYAREIGLTLVERANSDGTPIRLSIVSQDGLSTDTMVDDDPGSSESERSRRVRRRLDQLVDRGDREAEAEPAAVRTDDSGRDDSLRVRRDAARGAETLNGGDVFAQTLKPYFETMGTYSERLAAQPLFSRVTEGFAGDDDAWFVLVTDDSTPETVLGIARLASIRGVELSVFVLPSAFFSDRDPATVETLAAEHRDCQSFINELNDHDEVTAVEVGPHERPRVDPTRPTRRAHQ